MWQKLKNFFEEWRYQLFYFIFYAGYMPLLLYLPVYLRHVGLTTVQVGVLNGLRPILQSLVTPLLVIVGEKLRSNKLLFVISCFIAIAKVLIMFILIRPQRQLCIENYVNGSTGVTVVTSSKLVHVSLLVADNSEQQNILNKRIARRELETFNITLKSRALTRSELVLDRRSNSSSKTEKNLNKKEFIRDLLSEHKRNEVGDDVTNLKILNPSKRERNEKVDTRVKFDILYNKVDTRVKFDILYNKVEIRRIFIALVFLTIFADPFIATIFTLIDYSCIANPDIGHGYREVRLWETIGWGTMTPIIGLVIYELSHEMCGIMVETFHYVFFFFITFVIIALPIGIQIDFTQKIPEIVSSKVHSAHSNLQYGMFSIISAFAGFGHGFLLTFVNWFIDNIGGNTVIMGVATASKSIVDIILYFQLPRLIEKLGYVYTVSLCLVGHIVVFVMYYGITNAWLVILAEAIYGIVYGSLMSTCASFLVNSAPAGSSARMQAIFHGIYWGVGTAAGCILSGYRLDTVGFPNTFLTFACITAIVTIIFLAVQIQMFLKVDSRERDRSAYLADEKSEPEDWNTLRLSKLDDDEKRFR